jgi:glycine cleavage system regulatory protein
MKVPLILTLIGKDRPGIVESIASAVAAQGGNWLESRMMRLGGQFAGILRLEVGSPEQQVLSEKLRALQTQGLQVTIQADGETPKVAAEENLLKLELVGQDRPGIVKEISSALARNGVNVEELETECSSAPMTGETLFHARAEVQVPANCDLQRLRSDLEKIAADLMVELKVRHGKEL